MEKEKNEILDYLMYTTDGFEDDGQKPKNKRRNSEGQKEKDS